MQKWFDLSDIGSTREKSRWDFLLIGWNDVENGDTDVQWYGSLYQFILEFLLLNLFLVMSWKYFIVTVKQGNSGHISIFF
jgi:hypothetical protein